jgi:outer membrane lipoprotein-sorting protein
MKTALLLAVALGLSTAAAQACQMHGDHESASAGKMTVASIEDKKAPMTTVDEDARTAAIEKPATKAATPDMAE